MRTTRFEERYYYTLYDLCHIIDPTHYNSIRDYEGGHFKEIFSPKFVSAPYIWTRQIIEEEEHYVPKTNVSLLWIIIYNRYKNHYCFWMPHSETSSDFYDNMDLFLTKIINTLSVTYNKYSTLLDLYESQKENLLNKIKSTSESVTRFNDTPQLADPVLELEGDSFVTNLTKGISASETDGDTPIRRLKEIEDNYQNLLLKWADEFDRIFIEEGNV